MGYIVFLIVLWIGMSYFFKSFLAATIVLAILIIAMVIWAFKTVPKSKKSDNAMDDDKYSGIQYRPIRDQNAPVSNASKAPYISNVPIVKYDIYHRSKDGFCDNMNYRLYQCKATFSRTNRKRSVKIEAFYEDDAIEQLRQDGFVEPFEIIRIPFPEITDAQKEAIGNIYLGDVCKYDASAILSKKYDGDSTPNPELISYATECHMKFSNYIGKKALYDLIFSNLELRDKIAFFVFCVYRYTTNDRLANFNKSPYRDLFYSFSDENLSNDAFVKSMNKYSGREIRFFGTLTIGNVKTTGGSTHTIAYKTAIEFLKKHFTLSTISGKTM